MIELRIQDSYRYIWSSDLAKFANQFLDREWNLHVGEDFPAQGYCTKFEIGPREYITEEGDFDSWLAGGQFYPDEEEGYFRDHEPNCEEMMQYLFNEGHVPAGKYIVEVWW